jgi:hypothetical protein
LLGARARGIGFEQAAQLVDLGHLFGIEPRDDRPLTRDDLDEPFRLQMPQHLAHHGAAYAELVAQCAFHEPRAGPEISLHYRAAQFVQREFTQGLGIAIDSEV